MDSKELLPGANVKPDNSVAGNSDLEAKSSLKHAAHKPVTEKNTTNMINDQTTGSYVEDNKTDKANVAKTEVLSDETSNQGYDHKNSTEQQTANSENISKIKKALEKKENGSGFVLSAMFETNIQAASREDGEEKLDKNIKVQDELNTSVSPEMSRNDYKVGYADDIQGIEKEFVGNLETKSTKLSPTYITELPTKLNEEERTFKAKNKKENKRATHRGNVLRHLGLNAPVQKYKLKLSPLPNDGDPNNPAPINPDIYITTAPIEGGTIKTPFYIHLEIPKHALLHGTRIKFEKQDCDRMNLNLNSNVKLCSNVIDISPKPLGCYLGKSARVKMRILDQCALNKFEQLTILSNRGFSWQHLRTTIVTDVVNDEKHYYAVTDTQCLGKFLVISSCVIDRFVITRAGGYFGSNVDPDIGIVVEENLLKTFTPQLVEVKVRSIRQETVDKICKVRKTIEGVQGRLVAASSIVEISKQIMPLSSHMERGLMLPHKIALKVSVPIPASNDNNLSRRCIKIMQKINGQHQKGRRHHLQAYGETKPEVWEDITEGNQLAVDEVSGRNKEDIKINVTVPGQCILLNFEEGETEDDIQQKDLSDLCDEIVELNQTYDACLMIHQKISQPQIFSLHLVTSNATELIHNTMVKTKDWNKIYLSNVLPLIEWQPIKCQIKGQLQLTVNQVMPNTRFFSQRWQGYQIQLEASDNSFASSNETFVGAIVISQENEDKKITEICETEVKIPRLNAIPYKPTVIIKPIPKITIFREYKLRSLKNLSPGQLERYRQKAGG